MNYCPKCREQYSDEYSFCLADGTPLVSDADEEPTVIRTTGYSPIMSETRKGVSPIFAYLTFGLIALLIGGGLVFWLKSESKPVVDDKAAVALNVVTANQNGSNNLLSNSSNVNAETLTVTATPDKNQLQAVINKYLAGVASVQGYQEFKESRKLHYGDLDGDGDEDVVVDSVMGMKTGGNFYTQVLSAYKNSDGKFTAITDVAIGGKLYRDAEFKSFRNGKIFYNLKIYDKDKDPACCPSIKGKTSYALSGEKLVER